MSPGLERLYGWSGIRLGKGQNERYFGRTNSV